MIRALIHPGEQLRDMLEEMDMSASQFSKLLDVPTNRITQIMNGQRAITADTALRLAHYFGNSPEFWLNLQRNYDLVLAEREAGDALKALPTLARTSVTPPAMPI